MNLTRFPSLKAFFSLFVLATVVNLNACKKQDAVFPFETERPKITEEKFFNVHRTADPTEKAIVDFLKRQNDNLHFVEKTVKQIGFPHWDKAIAKQKGKTSGRQNAFHTADSVSIFYIPFVRDAENYVNASMLVIATPSDTSFSYLCDWQYKNKVHGSPTVDTSAEYFALFFMMLDNKTFGHREFNLTDNYLFIQAPSRTGKRKLGFLGTSTASKGKEGLLLYHEICNDIYFCSTPDWCSEHGGCDYLNCLAPEGDPDHCWGITICNGWWEDDWTGGGGPSGIPPPSGGGGDTGIPPTVPCTGVGNIGGQLLPCDPTNPPAPPDPGWVPIDDNTLEETITSLQNNLGLDATQIDWLRQNRNITDLIFDELSENENSEEAKLTSKIFIDLAMADKMGSPFDDEIKDILDRHLYPNTNPNPSLDPMFWNYIAMQIAINKLEHCKTCPEPWTNFKCLWEATKEIIHGSLDMAGLVPVVGEVADVANGIIYTLEGDGINATLSWAATIPIAGWTATGVKFAKKAITFADGTITGLKWFKRADGFISFGKSNSNQFRKLLGLIPGDPRQAHHIIPWELCDDFGQDVIQKAASAQYPFHVQDILNGVPLTTAQHLGSHPQYTERVRQALQKIKDSHGVNLTPEIAYNEIVYLTNRIKAAILANPNSSIENIIF